VSLLCLAVATAPAAAQSRPLRVLFIGNSYTYFNDLPGLVASLGRGVRPVRPVHTEMVAQPGVSLRDHWLDGAALAAIRRTRWDYVVLQEQSMLGVMMVHGRPTVNDVDLFHEFGRRFIREITAAGATPVLYLTWARRPTPETQDRLTRAYAALAAETGARLAPVGVAWQQARAQRPALELFDPDGTHPSPAGSYLAAVTLWATITRTPARALPATVSGRVLADSFRVTWTGAVAPLVTLADRDAAFLQGHANAAIAAVASLPTAPVAGARLQPLPAGTPPTWQRLAGDWSGTMRLFDAPVTVTLTVSGTAPRPQLTWREVGTGWSAAYTVAAAALDSAGLSFTISDPRFLAPDAHHRAVLVGDSLVGHAEVGSAMQVPRLVGSWTLTRAGATAPDPMLTEHPTGTDSRAAAVAGGLRPCWSGDGRWVYFRGRDSGALWRVAVALGEAVTGGTREQVPGPTRITNALDLDRRTGRMAVTVIDSAKSEQLLAVPNWRKALRAATSGRPGSPCIRPTTASTPSSSRGSFRKPSPTSSWGRIAHGSSTPGSAWCHCVRWSSASRRDRCACSTRTPTTIT
jgi:lysophospholipase L1-like esterase